MFEFLLFIKIQNFQVSTYPSILKKQKYKHVYVFNPRIETEREIYSWLTSNIFITEVLTDRDNFFQDTLSVCYFRSNVYIFVVAGYTDFS